MNTTGITQNFSSKITNFFKSSPSEQKETGQPHVAADGFQKGEEVQENRINWKAIGKLALGTVVGTGLGVFAGLATGPLAAAAGAAAGLAGAIGVGVLAGAVLGDKFGHGDSSRVAGIAMGTTILSAAVGLGGGIYTGLAISHPIAAVAMGALGAVGGFGKALLKMASKD